jgi:hypothetical protein
MGEMTTLTMRYMRGHFVVTAPDIEPVILSTSTWREPMKPRCQMKT